VNPKKILIVDDDHVNRMILSEMLKLLGHDVELATGGQHAIEVSDQQAFAIILMDWQMPEVNGFQAATAIWTKSLLNKQTKIIAVTANHLPDEERACREHGFHDVLTKPFDVQQLEALMKRYLP
jgi:CheY-like chemotaxis protein